MIQALDALRRVGEEELSRVVTDEAGAFTLQGRMPASRLPAGLVLRGEKSGWLDAEGPGAALEVTSLPFEKTGLVYRMGRTFLVSGTVIDVVKGEPVRGARLHPESETERLGFLPSADGFFPILPSPDTKTDEGGRFRLDLGPMLAATLVAEAEGFLPGLARADRTHGRGEVQIRLLPVSAASVVRGTVFQGWGSPADGADVKPISLQRSDDSSRVGIHSSREYFDERTSRSGVRCAPDGTFSIPLPSGGSWKLTAEWEGAEGSATLSVAPGEVATCRIDLDSFRIAGWVVDETSGEPISG
ncbi:MAG TPA: hypothetical protein VKF62_00385, partial [Planctomycetota bacterium]|nr:hypothetical protein [Planctomycetota bacterium]